MTDTKYVINASVDSIEDTFSITVGMFLDGFTGGKQINKQFSLTDNINIPDNISDNAVALYERLKSYWPFRSFILRCFNKNGAIIVDSERTILITMCGNKGALYGAPESVRNIYEKLELKEPNNTTNIRWYFHTQHGNDFASIACEKRGEVYDEYYPYITDGLDKFFEGYNSSSSNVLILMGEPGTGKTSLVRHYINKYNMQSALTYDERVMKSDDFYIEFLTSDRVNCLILEDSDLILRPRESEDNPIMSKLLNVSDGLVTLKSKKIIFTTNIKRLADIDPAIIRPGRCYDVVSCRALTKTEVATICQKHNLDPLDDGLNEYSLSQIFNRTKLSTKNRRVGF